MLPLLFVTSMGNMWLAVVLIGIALAGHQSFSTNILSIPPDMFPKRAVGSVIGLGGFMGGIGGMIMAKSTGLGPVDKLIGPKADGGDVYEA